MHSIIRNKKRKGLAAASLAAIMALAPSGAFATNSPEEVVENIDGSEVVIQIEDPQVQESRIEQPAIQEDHVPLALQEPDVFTSDYGESKVAKRMTQAEKNRNAAENDGWGGAITIIAMCIVLAALIVLSILFMIFGKVSEALLTAKKKKAKAEADHAPQDDIELASGEIIAAISLALSEFFSDPHDIEDTHLTIRRMQKAYSPWNSKIYNLRSIQEHRRNPSTEINFHESKRIQV